MKQDRREYLKRYRDEHREKAREVNAKYYREHPEYFREYRRVNRERLCAYYREYRKRKQAEKRQMQCSSDSSVDNANDQSNDTYGAMEYPTEGLKDVSELLG